MSALQKPTSSCSDSPKKDVLPSKTLKRRRTRSHNSSPSPGAGRGFFVPGFEACSGSNGKMMSLSEVMDAAKGISNMFLAHEIAVDKNFMLHDLKGKEPENSLEAQVKKVVHTAFWDLLKDQLNEDPPNYTQAFVLLGEVKEALVGLLSPHQKRVIDMINEKLDIELIRQQAENNVLDFNEYATFVLTLMGQLCAPVRDDEIAEIKEQTEIVPLFQGILETLKHMKLDMANFHIMQARPLIVSQSVEYEKEKFKEFLKTQDDGLFFTRSWLKRHAPLEDDPEEVFFSRMTDAKFQKLQIQRILIDAYIELLEWDEDVHGVPETLVMDWKRVEQLRDLTERASVSTAVILLTFSNVSSYIIPADAQRVKAAIKKHIDILLEDFHEDSDLLQILPNVALQVVKEVNDYLSEKDRQPLPEGTSRNLQEQIQEMEDPNHRIRDLVQRGILEFNKTALGLSRAVPLQVPPGLTLCQGELSLITSKFLRLVNYNRSVFGDFYTDIITNHVLFKSKIEAASVREG